MEPRDVLEEPVTAAERRNRRGLLATGAEAGRPYLLDEHFTVDERLLEAWAQSEEFSSERWGGRHRRQGPSSGLSRGAKLRLNELAFPNLCFGCVCEQQP